MKNRFYCFMLAVLMGAGVMAGCGTDKEEAKASYRQMGITYMEQGDYAAAIEAFNEALSQEIGKIGADELDITYYKAAAQYAGGDYEAAMATYNAIIDFEKDAYEAYFLRGCLYCKQGNAEAAKTDFANAVKYKGNDYKLYIQIYENLLTLDEEEEAQGYLSKALQIKGNEVGNYENRGQIYYLMGEYDSAITELSTALEAGSTYANLYLAKTYDDMGDVATAEDYLKTYIASVPTDSTALNELGEMMLAGEKYAEAVLYLEQGLACEVVPSRGVLMHNLIVAYEYNGNFDKAWELVQEYVKLFPEDEGAQREYIFLKNRQMKEESTQDTEPAQDTQ